MNEPTTIAIVVPDNLFNVNGSTIRAERIISIIRKNYQFLVIARSDHPNSDLSHKIKVNHNELLTGGRYLKNPYLDIFLQLLWNFRLVENLIRSGARVVYGQGIYQLPGYFLLAKLLDRKIIYEAHSLSYKEQAQTSKIFAFFLYLLEFLMGKTCHGVVALSGQAYVFYRRINKSTFYVPVFVDTNLFCNKQKPIYETLNKHVGLIGPFNTKFNRCQLEYLSSNLEKFDERITFYLIGKSDKSLRNSKVVELGYLEIEDYAETLSKLDAVIVPVRIGTFGPKNKILESMACALPVFTTPQGILGLDLVEPDESILVYKEEVLADRINELLFSEDFLKQIRRNARKTVECFYSQSVCQEKILNLLDKVLRNA